MFELPSTVETLGTGRRAPVYSIGWPSTTGLLPHGRPTLCLALFVYVVSLSSVPPATGTRIRHKTQAECQPPLSKFQNTVSHVQVPFLPTCKRFQPQTKRPTLIPASSSALGGTSPINYRYEGRNRHARCSPPRRLDDGSTTVPSCCRRREDQLHRAEGQCTPRRRGCQHRRYSRDWRWHGWDSSQPPSTWRR